MLKGNIAGLMKQAQQMQENMKRAQAELEALEVVGQAILVTQHAATVDRKLSHDKHYNGHFTKALDELVKVKTSLQALRTRVETVGR